MVIAKRTEFRELSNEILSKGSNLRFRALGGSMHPFIRNGEVIEVKPVPSSDIGVGDVVFYRSSWGGMVAHRVLKKKQKAEKVVLITKGDSVPISDEEIYPEQVLGKVIAIERNGSKITLDKGLNRFKSLVWVKISPHSWWLYPLYRKTRQGIFYILRPIVRELQGFQIYRRLAKKVLARNINFKLATAEDVLSLSHFYNYQRQGEVGPPEETFPKISRSKSKRDYAHYFVAKKGEEILGSLVLKKFFENSRPSSSYLYKGWWIFGLTVKLRYRGLGMGEQLMKMALNKVAQEGSSEIKLLVFKRAKPAIKLYQKLGFKQISIPDLDKELDEEVRRGFKRRIIMAKKIDLESGSWRVES